MKTMPHASEIEAAPFTGRQGGHWARIKFCLLLAGLGGSQAIATATYAADVTTPAAAISTNDAAPNDTAEFPADKGIRFTFRNAPLETVLGYLSRAAGYIIHPQVSLNGRVDVISDQPLSKEEALALVEHVLAENGYAVIRDNRILTIISASDVRRRGIPVIKFTRLEDIPRNAEPATYIIPVRTLNPVALVNNLRPLISATADVQANESANALLVTDSQINIRHLADIVMQLDSVSSSINSIEVFPLKFADAKTMADLVKQLFPSQDAASRGGTSPVAGFFGAGGGPGGAGGGFGGLGGGFGAAFGQAAGGTASGASPGTRVTATSDDHSNSLIVSAPEAMIPMIRQLIQRLDQPTEEITEVKMFHLKNADPNEMATLIGNMFPDTSGSADAGQSPIQFGGAGFAFAGAATATTSTEPSQYRKKQVVVTAVPDARTQSLVISASKDVMAQIDQMITELDAINSGKLTVYRLSLNSAEPSDVMQIVQDLFPAGATTRSTTTQNNTLQQRAQTLWQNSLSSGAGSGNNVISTSSSGSGGVTGN